MVGPRCIPLVEIPLTSVGAKLDQYTANLAEQAASPPTWVPQRYNHPTPQEPEPNPAGEDLDPNPAEGSDSSDSEDQCYKDQA